MNRNVESRFALNPTNLDIGRSKFQRSHSLKTSFNTGDLVPIYVEEVLPGDTFSVKTSKLVRMQTLITPVMDNIYLDTYFFFVPNRLVWNNWKEFNGENTDSAWIPPNTFTIPQVTSPNGGWSVGTIADYMGIPTGVDNLSVSALPFRAYALICNEWFRDENLSDPLYVPVGDATLSGVNTGNYVTDVVKGGKPFVAAKYHDYFTSCLPSPQKGPDVTIPGISGNLLVDTDSTAHAVSGNTLMFSAPNGSQASAGSGTLAGIYWNTNKEGWLAASSNAASLYGTPANNSYPIVPSNLIVDASGIAATTVNQMRLAFQIQKLYEKDARGGTRYVEILKSHFGVTSPDYRLQRPEYLGGNRISVNVNQVVQTSGTASGSTAQGNVAGYSVTSDSHADFTKSFTEHGFIIGLTVARYDHTYQQGLDRMWSRKDRFDYYWPVLANIGEQAVLNKEIFAQGTAQDDEVFGYQEAWADYRYKPNHVTGEMRSTYAQSLDSWHLGDDYSSLPSLSDSWIREDKANVDRVLAVSSNVSAQFFGDFYFDAYAVRPMPFYSIPGLIDHH